MKKNFLFRTVVDVILAAALIGIIMGHHSGAIIGGLITFGCGIWMSRRVNNNLAKSAVGKKYTPLEIVGIGVIIGMCFAVGFGFMFVNGLVCLFSFLGAILGAVVGLLQK